jgi:hypothetical protein
MGSRSDDIAGPSRLQATDALDRRYDDPSAELLWQVISGLTTGDNYFLMVQHVPDGSKEGTYIETAVLTDGRFTVEYQDGDLQHHFHAEVENARAAYEVVMAWAFDRPGWREMLAWRREELG